MFEKILYRNIFNKRFAHFIVAVFFLMVISAFQIRGNTSNLSLYETIFIGSISYADMALSTNYIILPFFISYIGMYVINSDEKNSFTEIMSIRCNNKVNYRRKLLISAVLVGGVIAIIPTLVQIIVFAPVLQSKSIDLFSVPYEYYLFSSILISHPFIFFLLNLVILYFFGVATVSLSLLVKYISNPKWNIEVVIPFVLHMLLLLVASVAYNISFDRYMYYAYSIFSSIGGIIFFIAIPIVSMVVIYNGRKKRDYI